MFPSLCGKQQTPDTISIKVEEDSIKVEEDSPGSSHMSGHNGELRILSVYGKGEGPLAVDGHDTLFTASADHSVVKSLERGERSVCGEERSVQVGNHLLIQHPEELLPLFHLQHTPRENTHL